MEPNGRVGPLFVVVTVAFILIQSKVAVQTGIDAQLDRVVLLRSKFFIGTQRDNRARTNEERKATKRSVDLYCRTSFECSACPEVEPLRLGKIGMPSGRRRLGDRSHENCRPKQVLYSSPVF
jgi:hypothetical protein